MRSKNKRFKEVKKSSLLDIVFSSLDKGKLTKEICNDLKISKQNLQYYLDKLKKDGYIKKVGYGVWQTSKNRVANLCRGHGFMWHLKLPKEIEDWDKILNKKKIQYKLINNKHTHQIYFRNNKIWISKKSIIIYDINSYFGNNAVGSRKLAFFALRGLLNALEYKLGVRLTKGNKYIVKTSRQHYSLIKNCLAIQCNKEGKKINVYNEKGLWFTIDNSYNLEEAETLHPETALIDNLGIQRYFNEHKETNFEVTPKFILNCFAQSQSQLQRYSQQIRSHLKLIQEYRKENIAWRKNKAKEIREELKQGHQTSLGDFK